ncbi:hypothetical protein [Okeania sp. SIO1I7]|nr:hypothetical protein [Okeania sp. SIO1I7]
MGRWGDGVMGGLSPTPTTHTFSANPNYFLEPGSRGVRKWGRSKN